MGRKAKDLTDLRFGRLTVTRREKNAPSGNLRWSCSCECGSEIIVDGCNLKNGSTRSCGCLRRELASKSLAQNKIAVTHGLTNSREYALWQRMRRRIKTNPRYAARGMYQPWFDQFEIFYTDLRFSIGLHPGAGWSIDRIKNDQGYFPGNIRWLTMDANRRRRKD